MSKLSVTIAGEGMRGTISIPTPNSTMFSILSEFCKKNKQDPDNYQLKYKKNSVDLQLPWRLTGLPNNATLDIEYVQGSKKKTGEASIAVQLPDGKRVVAQYPIKTTLWQVLLQSEKLSNTNITRVSQVSEKQKKELYVVPTIGYMNNSIKTVEEIQKKTLADLGLRHGDNALLRVTMEPSDKTIAEMENELNKSLLQEGIAINKATNSSEPAPVTSTKNTGIENQPKKQELQQEITIITEEQNDSMEVDEMKQASVNQAQKSHLYLPIKDDYASHVKLCKMTNPQFDPKELEIEESEFELTATELKELLDAQEKRRAESEILKTQKIKETEKKKTEKKYPKVVIRFRYPGGLIIQAAFDPNRTIGNLYTFIPKTLENPTTAFYLYVSPPVKRLDDKEKTLQEMNLVPAAIINVALDKKVAKESDKEPTIKSEFMPLLQDLQPEDIPKSISENSKPEQEEKDKAKNSKFAGEGKVLGNASGEKKPKNIPKWLKPTK